MAIKSFRVFNAILEHAFSIIEMLGAREDI